MIKENKWAIIIIGSIVIAFAALIYFVNASKNERWAEYKRAMDARPYITVTFGDGRVEKCQGVSNIECGTKIFDCKSKTVYNCLTDVTIKR